jgi:hypothetical protein
MQKMKGEVNKGIESLKKKRQIDVLSKASPPD